MPTYEYECKSCGHTFEFFQSMSDAALTDCPQCGKAVRRLIHGGTGVIFKGSGFYVTDKGKNAAASSKTAKPGETAASTEGTAAPSPAAPSSGSGTAGGESAGDGAGAKTAGSAEKAKPAAKTA